MESDLWHYHLRREMEFMCDQENTFFFSPVTYSISLVIQLSWKILFCSIVRSSKSWFCHMVRSLHNQTWIGFCCAIFKKLPLSRNWLWQLDTPEQLKTFKSWPSVNGIVTVPHMVSGSIAPSFIGWKHQPNLLIMPSAVTSTIMMLGS